MKDLQFYIGVKAIKAKPMTRGEWRALPRISGDFVGDRLDDKNKDEKGYLVQYENSNNPNIVGYDKYVAWSPKQVFEESYSIENELSFGMALEAMKLGYVLTHKLGDKLNYKGICLHQGEYKVIWENGTIAKWIPDIGALNPSAIIDVYISDTWKVVGRVEDFL